MNEQWNADFAEAKAKWQARAARAGNVVFVEASAGTGSRYVVIVSGLPLDGGVALGGAKLVSVMYPWKAVYPVNSDARGLHETYIYEKFGRDGKMPQFGGDAAGLLLTIRLAIMVFDGELGTYPTHRADDLKDGE